MKTLLDLEEHHLAVESENYLHENKCQKTELEERNAVYQSTDWSRNFIDGKQKERIRNKAYSFIYSCLNIGLRDSS